MKNAVVLGIGNRLMGDDGIGIYVVEELIRRKALPDCRLVVGETDTDYCMSELGETDFAVLIDAASSGGKPCTVTAFPLGETLEKLPYLVTPHNFNLLHTMRRYHYKGDGMLIAIEACFIGYRFGVSPVMEARFSRIVDEVLQYIEDCLWSAVVMEK